MINNLKNIKLVNDWKRVIMLSLSFWAQVAGLIVLIAPELIYAKTGIDSDPVILWWAAVLLLIFGLAGRLIKQSNNTKYEWIKIVAVLIVIASVVMLASSRAYASTNKDDALDVAVPLIAKWEGLRLNAYLDIVGVPTICYGSTRGINLGMKKTKAECDLLLRSEVKEYQDGWLEYVSQEAYTTRLPSTRQAAYTSLAYNVGIRAAGRSTATRRLNAGNIEGGCIAIGWWNKAGNRVVRGLVNRRIEEVELCLI